MLIGALTCPLLSLLLATCLWNKQALALQTGQKSGEVRTAVKLGSTTAAMAAGAAVAAAVAAAAAGGISWWLKVPHGLRTYE
jgi:hypothetical protein